MNTTPAARPGRASVVALATAGTVLAAVATLLLALTLPTRVAPPLADHGGEAQPQVTAPGASERTIDAGFAFWGTDRQGEPLRWDACRPIRFVLSTYEMPEHARQDLLVALAMLAEASGLDLVLEGETAERPDARRPLVERSGDGWRWRPVLVAWSSPGEGDLPLTTLDRGVALPVAVIDGDREAFVTGQVVLNGRRSDLVPGFADRGRSIGATLIHEIGHILGLDHVDDVRQIMSTDPGSGPVRLGDGDLEGLRSIGADAGCLAAPDPSSGRGLATPP